MNVKEARSRVDTHTHTDITEIANLIRNTQLILVIYFVE